MFKYKFKEAFLGNFSIIKELKDWEVLKSFTMAQHFGFFEYKLLVNDDY